PVFLGDDLTDEPAFELVNRCEGLSVLVGAPRASAARARLADAAAVRAWLAELQAQPVAALGRLTAEALEGSGRGDPSRGRPPDLGLRSQVR
ncbi:MAG TPA: hypothetical protein VND24_01445, partial [Steroidobacteraceae bacterium]|nr:hypothetical protein [Steroidobacteraceae bacterium]